MPAIIAPDKIKINNADSHLKKFLDTVTERVHLQLKSSKALRGDHIGGDYKILSITEPS